MTMTRSQARAVIYDLVSYLPGLSDAELAGRGIKHGGRAAEAGRALLASIGA